MLEHLTGEILVWARDNEHVLVSHDLDFSAILAASAESCSSRRLVRDDAA